MRERHECKQLRPVIRLLALLAAGVVARHAAAESGAAATPRVEVPEVASDFGSVRQGEKVSRKFTIRNTGAADLVLGNAEISGAGVATVRMRGTIAAGRAGEVAVMMDTKRLAGDVKAVVAFATNDRARPRVELSMTGR